MGVDVGHHLVTQNQRLGAAGVASVGRVAAAPSHDQAASSILLWQQHLPFGPYNLRSTHNPH